MKQNTERKKLIITIVIGLLLSTISFVYYYAFKNVDETLITILMVIDIMYCILECFSVFTNDSDPLKGKIKRTIIAVSLYFIVFLVICIFPFLTSETRSLTISIFTEIVKISLFLSPSIVILYPVMWFACECLG